MKRWIAVAVLLSAACAQDEDPLVYETDLLDEDGVLPVLDAPLSPEETQSLREGFDWTTSDALAETDPDGRPALYYLLVYVADAAQEQILDLLDVTYNPLPIFPEERERWAGQSGVFTHLGDGQGHFEFVVMPGAVFNELRTMALDGEALFAAIVTRDAPVAEARYPMGALRYEYLVENGFTYGTDGGAAAMTPDPTGATTEPLILELIALLASSHDVRDGVDDAISEIDRNVRGRVRIAASLRVHQTDADFGAPLSEYSSAWRGGTPLRLENVPMVAQSAMGTIRANTNSTGTAVIEVAHGQMYTLCARGQNHAASVSHSDRPVHLCTFEASGDFLGGDELRFSAPDAGAVHVLRVSDYHFNMIAQMTDARDYVEERFGYRVSRSAGLLIGPAADAFGAFNDDRAFALCGGYNTFAVHSIAAILGFFDSIIEPFGITTWRIAGHDIAFPSAGSDTATHSRLVPIHEYGHFLMCDLVATQGYDKITEYLFDVVWTSLTTPQAPGVSNLTALEGFADWFASRVAGGLNYVSFPSAAPDTNGRRSGSSVAYFCDPAAPFCIEDNFGGMDQRTPAGANDPFQTGVAQLVSILHDAFDGEVSGGRSVGIGAYYSWDATDNVYRQTGTDRHQSDEEVALPARALLDLFAAWSTRHGTITVENFMNALARVALDHGFTEAQVCQLFAIHEPANDCTALVDMSDLDTTRAVPNRPVILSADPTSPNEIEVNWEDLTPFASTETAWEVLGGSAGRDTWRSPYFRRGQLFIGMLEPDTRYEIAISNINGMEGGPQARTQAVTLAEPVSTLRLTPGRGQMTVEWDPVIATSYVVELEEAGASRDVITVSDPMATIGGLTEGIDYTFRVYSLNQVGVRGEPSEPATGQVMMPDVIFVAASRGNDTAPGAGSALSPYATFDAAMAAAAVRGATVLRMEEADYTSSVAHGIDTSFSIEGGFLADAGGFTRQAAGTRSTIRFLTGAATGRCTTDRFAPGRDSLAPLIVGMGAELRLRSVAVENQANGDASACSVAVHLEGGHIVVDDTVIEGYWMAWAGACGAAISGRSVGGVHPNVTITDSNITGPVVTGGENGISVVGLCLDGAGSVRIEDSIVSASAPSFSISGNPSAHVGVALRDVRDLQVARSLLATRRVPPMGSFVTVSRSGYLAGLSATSSGSVRIDNSVVYTHAGGDDNRAAEIGSVGSSLLSLFAYHTVFNAGGNWSENATPPPAIEGAGLYLTGDLSNAELGLFNSTFTYAAGAQSVLFTSVFTGLDRRNITDDPRRLRIQGNVFSVPAGSGNIARFAICGLSEFEGIGSEVELNRITSHRCTLSSDTSTWVASDNRALTVAAREDLGCPSCGPNHYCLSATCTPRNVLRTLSFQSTGYPENVDLGYVYSSTGIALSGLTHATEVASDRIGRARNTTVREGAGAFLR